VASFTRSSACGARAVAVPRLRSVATELVRGLLQVAGGALQLLLLLLAREPLELPGRLLQLVRQLPLAGAAAAGLLLATLHGQSPLPLVLLL
jgi:hypothetical protein